MKDVTKGISFYAVLDLSDEEVEVVLAGGRLRHLKKQLREMGVDTGAELKEIRVEA